MHNQPSDEPKPSRDDIEVTKEIAKAAGALAIARCYDHLVMGRQHASFRILGLPRPAYSFVDSWGAPTKTPNARLDLHHTRQPPIPRR
jgi:hypothetical protein